VASLAWARDVAAASLKSVMDERVIWLWAAGEAKALGRRWIAAVTKAIRRWWRRMGRRAYPDASRLFVTADGGGSNGYRTRLWKLELQRFADESGLKVIVSHYPPGTSKWNKIEHRMFCHITQNWRGRPLESVETIVSLIGSTTTRLGSASRLRSTATPTRRRSRSWTRRSPVSTSSLTSSTATGTTHFSRRPHDCHAITIASVILGRRV
jgi:hypothetical protein